MLPGRWNRLPEIAKPRGRRTRPRAGPLLQSRPLAGLAISAWLTWDDAVLTEAFPSTSTVHGVPGDRLPNSARFSGKLSLQQEFSITGRLTGFAGATVSYVGDRVGTFQATSERQNFPAYTQANLRFGMCRTRRRLTCLSATLVIAAASSQGAWKQFPPTASSTPNRARSDCSFRGPSEARRFRIIFGPSLMGSSSLMQKRWK